MENASKALIMAGGMMLAILIVGLLLYAWGLFSEYQSSQDSLADIEDTAKFNEQFSNYDRDNVRGYELLSLVNKVIDYNYRKSNATDAKNDEKFTPITLKINLGSDKNRKKLAKDEELRLFKEKTYTQSDATNKFQSIMEKAKEIEELYGGSDQATKIAKGIDSIFISSEQGEQGAQKLNEAINKFNACSTKTKVATQSELNDQKINAYTYYEFMQFKSAKFDSEPASIKYDANTGRITQMEFTFNGKLY